MRVFILALATTFCAGTVSADQQAAEACKSKLSPIGQEIYAASLAQHPTEATGREIVKSEVEKLMAEGKISMSDARSEGQAAGDCLKLLK
ncbi:hypothetical protein [Sedimentitalea todarodis]|uniref:Uncharacterized protein n=1 Tax=Sedimentitalea todarodis TaxID=1631240 RepID=A0ABU3VGG5_9RHOB|nr:hypothetical protein [Sedimentitalea todarodis]MDU9005271.1 hypothetical protein [Sedimentitalea todarodis]